MGSLSRMWIRLVAPVVVVVALVVTGLVSYQLGRSAVPAAVPVADPNHLKAQPIDVGFASDMLDHHEQAVQMALLALNRSSNPAIRTMALKIATGQRRESGILMQFLRDRGIDIVDQGRMVMAWMGEPTPRDKMPGLATTEQMVELINAEEADVDRLFLQLMINHHQGGVHMAEFAAQRAETQDLRDLASRMVLEQKREILDMQHMLSGGE